MPELAVNPLLLLILVSSWNYVIGQTNPTNIACNAVNATALAITWTQASDASVAGYHVDLARSDGLKQENAFSIELNDKTYESYTFHGLGEYATYAMSIHSYFTGGTNGTDFDYTCQTDPWYPDAGNFNFTCWGISYTEITCTWENVTKVYWNGILGGYQLQYATWTNDQYTFVNFTMADQTYTIPSLTFDTWYVIHLRTFNQFGMSPYASYPAKTLGFPVVNETLTRYFCYEAVPGTLEFGWLEMPCTIYVGIILALLLLTLLLTCICCCQCCCGGSKSKNNTAINIFNEENNTAYYDDGDEDDDDYDDDESSDESVQPKDDDSQQGSEEEETAEKTPIKEKLDSETETEDSSEDESDSKEDAKKEPIEKETKEVTNVTNITHITYVKHEPSESIKKDETSAKIGDKKGTLPAVLAVVNEKKSSKTESSKDKSSNKKSEKPKPKKKQRNAHSSDDDYDSDSTDFYEDWNPDAEENPDINVTKVATDDSKEKKHKSGKQSKESDKTSKETKNSSKKANDKNSKTTSKDKEGKNKRSVSEGDETEESDSESYSDDSEESLLDEDGKKISKSHSKSGIASKRNSNKNNKNKQNGNGVDGSGKKTSKSRSNRGNASRKASTKKKDRDNELDYDDDDYDDEDDDNDEYDDDDNEEYDDDDNEECNEDGWSDKKSSLGVTKSKGRKSILKNQSRSVKNNSNVPNNIQDDDDEWGMDDSTNSSSKARDTKKVGFLGKLTGGSQNKNDNSSKSNMLTRKHTIHKQDDIHMTKGDSLPSYGDWNENNTPSSNMPSSEKLSYNTLDGNNIMNVNGLPNSGDLGADSGFNGDNNYGQNNGLPNNGDWGVDSGYDGGNSYSQNARVVGVAPHANSYPSDNNSQGYGNTEYNGNVDSRQGMVQPFHLSGASQQVQKKNVSKWVSNTDSGEVNRVRTPPGYCRNPDSTFFRVPGNNNPDVPAGFKRNPDGTIFLPQQSNHKNNTNKNNASGWYANGKHLQPPGYNMNDNGSYNGVEDMSYNGLPMGLGQNSYGSINKQNSHPPPGYGIAPNGNFSRLPGNTDTSVPNGFMKNPDGTIRRMDNTNRLQGNSLDSMKNGYQNGNKGLGGTIPNANGNFGGSANNANSQNGASYDQQIGYMGEQGRPTKTEDDRVKFNKMLDAASKKKLPKGASTAPKKMGKTGNRFQEYGDGDNIFAPQSNNPNNANYGNNGQYPDTHSGNSLNQKHQSKYATGGLNNGLTNRKDLMNLPDNKTFTGQGNLRNPNQMLGNDSNTVENSNGENIPMSQMFGGNGPLNKNRNPIVGNGSKANLANKSSSGNIPTSQNPSGNDPFNNQNLMGGNGSKSNFAPNSNGGKLPMGQNGNGNGPFNNPNQKGGNGSKPYFASNTPGGNIPTGPNLNGNGPVNNPTQMGGNDSNSNFASNSNGVNIPTGKNGNDPLNELNQMGGNGSNPNFAPNSNGGNIPMGRNGNGPFNNPNQLGGNGSKSNFAPNSNGGNMPMGKNGNGSMGNPNQIGGNGSKSNFDPNSSSGSIPKGLLNASGGKVPINKNGHIQNPDQLGNDSVPHVSSPPTGRKKSLVSFRHGDKGANGGNLLPRNSNNPRNRRLSENSSKPFGGKVGQGNDPRHNGLSGSNKPNDAWANDGKADKTTKGIRGGTKTPVKELKKVEEPPPMEAEPMFETNRLGKKFPFLRIPEKSGAKPDNNGQGLGQGMRKNVSDSALVLRGRDIVPVENSADKDFPSLPDTLPNGKNKGPAEALGVQPETRDQIFYGFGVGRWRVMAAKWLNKWKMKKRPVKTARTSWD